MLLHKKIANAIITSMELKDYIAKTSISSLAKEVGVSPAVVYQWMMRIRPVPIKRCHRVVAVTKGEVTLQDLRPDDWYMIWPELVDQETS